MSRRVVLWYGLVICALQGQSLYGQNAAPAQVTFQLPMLADGRLLEEARLALAKAIAAVPTIPEGPPRVLKGETVIPRVNAAGLIVKATADPWPDFDPHDGGRVLDRNHQGAVIQAQGGPAEVNPDDFVTLDEITRQLDDAIALNGTDKGALLMRAVLHGTERRLEPALADMDRLIALHPQQIEFLFYRSMLYQYVERLSDAERDLNRAIELEPNSIYALVKRSGVLESRDDLEGAIRDLDTCLRISADYAPALTRRGYLKYALNRNEAALEDINASLRLTPKDWRALVCRGGIHLSLKDYSRAVNDFSAAIELSPDHNASLYQYRAVAQIKADNRAEALQDLNEAIRLGEKSCEAYSLRGSLRLDSGDKAGSRADFALAANAVDLEVEKSLLIAKHLSNLDAREEAAKVYERAATLPATTAPQFRARANARHQIKSYALSIEDCSAALELDSSDIESRMRRALLLIGLKQYERAQLDLDELLALNPVSVEMLRWRALCWYERKEVDKAIADYTRILELAPADLATLLNRGNLFKSRGQYSKALDDFGAALKVDSSSIYALRRLANIWASCPNKDYRNGDAAVGAAKQLVARADAEPIDHILMAAAYAECGKFEDAVKHQEQAVAAKQGDPAYQAGEMARLKLYRAGKPYHEPDPVNTVSR